MSARVRLIAATILGVLVASTSAVLIAAPAQAATKSTDLRVTLVNKPDAVPGKKITYTIVVHNDGVHAAGRVRIDFKTSAALGKLKYKISKGRCSRSPKETTCLFGTIPVHKSATVRLTGVISKKLKKGTAVTNTVTVTSTTTLFNRANDKASDNYQIGIPRVVPAPTVSASAPNKIEEFNTATQKVFNLSQGVVLVTWVVLGAAVLWFIIGLTWRHRSRARRGISYTDDY
jgi:hypothetical protein